ncbi:MAG: hypothetical protein M3264_10820 [Thermoproteota archaeon]|nr:hypothetical protein [Thermoproteota archaeon]
MTLINKDVISNRAAVASISFFIAFFGSSFAHGQQEDDTTSGTAFGKVTQPQPMSTPRIIFTSRLYLQLLTVSGSSKNKSLEVTSGFQLRVQVQVQLQVKV